MGNNSDKKVRKTSFRRSGSKPLSDFLEVVEPIWNEAKNSPHGPADYSSGQRVPLWWKCDKSHDYQSLPANILKGQRCPYCSNRRVLLGFNDLASQAPQTSIQWDRSSNGIDPSEVLVSSAKRAFWLCDKNHRFERPIRDMVETGSCPYCSNKQVLPGFNDLKQLFPEVASELVTSDHQPTPTDQILAVTTKKYQWRCKEGHLWVAPVRTRTQGHGCPYCSKRLLDASANSLQALHPKIAQEWDFRKNAPVTPSQVMGGGPRRYWWICDLGHSWQTSIARRVSGRGCHFCANREVLSGFNDLAARYPDLANEWDLTKNRKLPAEILYGTNQKFWWLCPNAHSYQTSPSKRILESSGCPICANKLLREGFNDLESQRPILASRWSSKNACNPSEVFASSQTKFTFECPLGHEWFVQPSSVSNEKYCPTCANKSIQIGFNDIPTRFPEMATTFDSALNPGLDLRTVDPRSKIKISWRCSLGHVWTVAPANRVDGSGCPYCANKKVLKGFNDLETRFPEVAAQWSLEKNAKKSSEVNFASNSIHWWTCELGHSYRQAISNKTLKGHKCPYCSRKLVLKGFNDLNHELPELAGQWHPTRNGKLRPDMVVSGTSRRVWWKCSAGHEWPAAPSTRIKGIGCPTCNRGGFDPSRPGQVYFLIHSEYQARKVGIMNVDSARLRNFQGIGWRVIDLIQLEDGNLVRSVETAFFRWLRKDVGLPQFLGKAEMGVFAGASETFSMEGPTNFDVVAKLKAIVSDQSQSGKT